MPNFTTVAELVEWVRDGDRIGVSGTLFSRLPIALVSALCAAGRKRLHFISWGGGLPLEMLINAGAVEKAWFCFSSLDVFGLAPSFRAAVENGTLQAQDFTAMGMIQGLRATQHRLGSLPFVAPVGSELIERSGFANMATDPVDGRPIAAAPALELDAFLLHAQRADEAGNVELQGARALDLSAIGAATRVLATVEQIVPEGTFAADRRGYVVHKTFVHAVAKCTGGAYPSSCLPFYTTDYRALQEATRQSPLNIALPTVERMAFVSAAARIAAPTAIRHRWRSRGSIATSTAATPDEQLVVNLARQYTNESVCSAGAVSPVAMISYLLAKRSHAPGLTLITNSGGYVDVATRPMLMTLLESLDFQTAVAHAGGDETYHRFYQPGCVTHEVVASAQIDIQGGTNSVSVTTPAGKVIRLPGQGGMADVANMHRHFSLYVPRHSTLSLVERVSYVSAARGVLTSDERAARGWQPGEVRVFTNLCTFILSHTSRLLELETLNPGVSIADVAAATGFSIRPAGATTDQAPPPTSDELRLLREEVDPLGLRRLEFVAGKDRGELLAEIIDADEEGVRELLSAAAR